MDNLDPDPSSGCITAKSDEIVVESIQSAENLYELLHLIYLNNFLDSQNNFGHTALHVACLENKGESHFWVINYLVHKCTCDLRRKDRSQRTPLELLQMTGCQFKLSKQSIQEENHLNTVRECLLNKLWTYMTFEINHISQKRCKETLDICCLRYNKYRRKDQIKEKDDCTKKGEESVMMTKDDIEYHLDESNSIKLQSFGHLEMRKLLKSNKIFYVNRHVQIIEHLAILLQRSYRNQYRKKHPSKWISNSLSFHKTDEFVNSEREFGGWNWLKEKSIHRREIVDVDGVIWHEYANTEFQEIFYFNTEQKLYQWLMPDMSDGNNESHVIQDESQNKSHANFVQDNQNKAMTHGNVDSSMEVTNPNAPSISTDCISIIDSMWDNADLNQNLERNLAEKEDNHQTSHSLKARRKVVRTLQCAIVRQTNYFYLCRWGCGKYLRLRTRDKFVHEAIVCPKRVVPCALGCVLRFTEEEWLENICNKRNNVDLEHCDMTFRDWHEKYECPFKRLPCGCKSKHAMTADDVERHLKEFCPKRRMPPLECRLGCGQSFPGFAHQMLLAEQDRIDHEFNLCINRMISCGIKGCNERCKAKDMSLHQRKHIQELGVTLFDRPGTHTFEVPDENRFIKIQVWGAGGGSGFSEFNYGGDGGGGSYAEVVLRVHTGEKLQLCVGEGGKGGSHGLLDTNNRQHQHEPTETLGGIPGGGNGYSSGNRWACGGGGGYSIVQRRSATSDQVSVGGWKPLVVAAGGGGGGTHYARGGDELSEIQEAPRVDTNRNLTKLSKKYDGETGTLEYGGRGGMCANGGCTFPSESGNFWKGGNGCNNGGGGGGGYFGGGGGGTAPGNQ